jgi:hypothetical protein
MLLIYNSLATNVSNSRWIRLLFSREFPFEQFLVLWDTIFAVDPTLELIDLICVAMLIRIRWERKSSSKL